MEDNLPSSLGVDVLSISRRNVVADDLDIFCMLSDQMNQQSTNDRDHTTAQHNHRHIIFSRPFIELFEVGIQFDVLQQCLDTLVVGCFDRVHHSLERLPEGHSVVQHILVALLAEFLAIAQVVCEEIVRVSLRDCAVEIGEEDEPRVSLHRGKIGGCHGCGMTLQNAGLQTLVISGED